MRGESEKAKEEEDELPRKKLENPCPQHDVPFWRRANRMDFPKAGGRPHAYIFSALTHGPCQRQIGGGPRPGSNFAARRPPPNGSRTFGSQSGGYTSAHRPCRSRSFVARLFCPVRPEPGSRAPSRSA